MARFAESVRGLFQVAMRSRTIGSKVFDAVQRMLPSSDRVSQVEEFMGRPGQALPTWLTTQDTSPAGAPVFDFVADGAGGQWAMALATTNEIEEITLYQGDQRTIDLSKKPIVRGKLKVKSDVTGGGGLFAAGDVFVFGVASDRAAVLDNIVTNAWFRFEGANHNILVESDDGVTDTDDKDTGQDWVEDTFVELEIDMRNPAGVRFKVNGTDRTPTGFTFAVPSTGVVQVFCEVRKAAALNFDHKVTVDVLDLDADR